MKNLINNKMKDKVLVIIPFCCFMLAISCSIKQTQIEPDPIMTQNEPEPTTPCESIQPVWDGSRPDDSYQYPIVPGTEEWASLTTSEEMVEALQVPESVLKDMTTQAVVQAIWEHPMLFEIIFGSDGKYQFFFELLFSKNNAYLELVNRKDAGAALLDRLILADPLPPFLSCETHILEIMISQIDFLSQLGDCEKRKIAEIAFRNYELRENDEITPEDSGYMSGVGMITASLLMGRTMFADGYPPFVEAVNSNEELKYYLEGAYPAGYFPYIDYPLGFIYPLHNDIQQEIINFGNLFLNK